MSENTMNTPELVNYDIQPNFPYEDLTKNNSDLLSFMLAQEPGIDNHAIMLTGQQRSIYDVAGQALESLHIKTLDSPNGLYSFSHGFAGFEAVSDIVHPVDKLTYPTDVAAQRVSDDIVDTRPSDDIEFEAMMSQDDEPALPNNMTTDGFRPRYLRHGEDTIDLSPTHANFIVQKYNENLSEQPRNRIEAPIKMARHYMKLLATMPNTVDVMMTMAEARSETAQQVCARLAGTALAHSLQVRD